MEIDFSEFMLLVAGGVALSASFCFIHFASTLNRFNRSLALFVPIVLVCASIYTTMMLSDTGPTSSFRDSIASSIVALVSLFPHICRYADHCLVQDNPLNKSVGGRVVSVRL
ncbi:MAG: hypothetical protein Ct9H90mP24_2590 [Methanobacteriota archaeon]|nr:MAG: hypothetical protein Ct9H90mP24_2590 [Euryarchaeota archaeon]